MLRLWSFLLVRIDLIGQCVTMCAHYIHCVLLWTIHFLLWLHISSFNVKNPKLSTACHWWAFKYCASASLKSISILVSILIAFKWPIIWMTHYLSSHGCTYVTGSSAGLFSHPDCLVFQCWVCTTILFKDSIATTGPLVHNFVSSFLSMGHIHEGVPCHIVAVIGILDAAWSSVLTAYPSL